jgi:1,2-diacylglycerol 3-beta-galactosyltransferase
VDYVVSEGVGIWAPNTREIIAALQEWIIHPETRKQAAHACRKAARPQAAREIAHILANRLGMQN